MKESFYRKHANNIYNNYIELTKEIKREYEEIMTDDRRPTWMTEEWTINCLSYIYGLDTTTIKNIIYNK